MKIVVLLLLTCSVSAFAQGPKQKALQTELAKGYCSCLTDSKETDPEKILTETTKVCIKDFFTGKETLMEEIVAEANVDANLSGYEKGRVIGKEMMLNIIEDLIRDCAVFRNAIKNYKQGYIDQLKLKQPTVDSAIMEFKALEPKVTDNNKKALLYSVLAMMHEYAGKKDEAIRYYEMSVKLNPTTYGKGLLYLLKMED